jgi:glycerol-3-phosphate acyltransferase PlsY
MWYWYIVSFLLSYALGSIPFGFIVGKIKGHDLRREGSGNVGTTNVFRVVGKKEGIMVFILDLLKGFIPVFYFTRFSPYIGIVAVLGAITGHVTTPFLRFKGGKGIATGFGSLLALMMVPALLIFAVWIILLGISRRVSVGSLGAAIALPISYYFTSDPVYIPILIITILITIIVFVSHRSNIKRLIKKEEAPIF